MNGWPTRSLGEIFDIARGGSPRPIDKFITDDPDGVNWIMISDASESSKYIKATKKRISKDGVKRSRMVHPGDFLLTNSMSFGRPYIVQTTGCIHDGWLVLSGKHEVDQGFFFHLLGSDTVYAEFTKRAAGATVKNLNIDLVKGVEVSVPPLQEQRRIADVLDRAEALRAKRSAALAQLDALDGSLFLDLFGDPATNPKGWARVPLKDCASQIQIGPFGSLLHREDYVVGGIPLINPMHIVNGIIVPDQRQAVSARKHAELPLYHLRKGDIVLGRRGEMGRCAVVADEHDGMLCGTGSLFIRPDASKATAQYLQATLSSVAMRKRLEDLSLGVTMQNLNRGILESLPVSLPPVNLQRNFAHRIAAVEKLKVAHRVSLTEMDALFASLQHRAFRGEL